MGLDNGIVYKTKPLPKLGFISNFLPDNYLSFDYGIEVCYWRKCWNVRRDILEILQKSSDDSYKYNLTYSNIVSIRKLFASYLLRPSLWDEYSSIWTWAEMRRNIFHAYVALRWLECCVRTDISKGRWFQVYFYDSY